LLTSLKLRHVTLLMFRTKLVKLAQMLKSTASGAGSSALPTRHTKQ
jgi:hypothetical protein